MSIVVKPRMSEKTYGQSANRVFVFDIDLDINKHQVAETVEKTYEVEVLSVNIVIQKGKTKRYYRNRRYENGVRSDFKKAYVTLKPGFSIPIFAAVEEAQESAEKAITKKAKKVSKEK